MSTNGWVGEPIDLVRMPDGGLTSVDNSRLLAANVTGINIEATIHNMDDPIASVIAPRFTSRAGQLPLTWGEAIQYRIGNQNALYRTANPNGSFIIGWDGN